MSFIRPEAAAGMNRWREALYGGAILALGLFWIFGSRGLLYFLGFPVTIISLVANGAVFALKLAVRALSRLMRGRSLTLAR